MVKSGFLALIIGLGVAGPIALSALKPKVKVSVRQEGDKILVTMFNGFKESVKLGFNYYVNDQFSHTVADFGLLTSKQTVTRLYDTSMTQFTTSSGSIRLEVLPNQKFFVTAIEWPDKGRFAEESNTIVTA